MGKLITKFAHPKTRFGKYFLNVFIAGDQALGALVGYDPDETVSSHLGKLEHMGGIPRNRPIARGLAWILEKIDKGHCQRAIEGDEGKDSLRDRQVLEQYEKEHPYHGE